MKAAVFKKRDEMAVIDLPSPVAGAGEVILKVHNCGICGSDLHAVHYGIGMATDTVMGHEFCGEIHALGDGVDGYQLGDRVTSLPYIACGVCAWCRRDDAMHCHKLLSLGLGQLPGAYAEFVACSAASLLKLPPNVSSRAGALVVSELAPGRTELAMKLGADAVVNPTEGDPAETVRSITGRPPEIVFECIGVKSTLPAAIGMVGRHGHIVVIGVCMESDSIYPLTCVMKEVQINFALAYTRAEFQETINALANGTIDATPMITDVIKVDQVPEMFSELKRPGTRAKVMVEFPH